MPTSFSHIDLCLVTLALPLLQLLQNCYYYFCHCYCYFHTTLLLNTLLQILCYPGVVELTTQLLILENILWLPLCRINKFGLNTLPSKTVAIPYTCGLSNISTFPNAFPLVLDSNLHDLNETNPGLMLFSAELPWCCFCAEIKVLGMEQNFARIFYIIK